MKDESRAKWPELIAEQNKATAQMTGHQVWYVKAPLNIVFTLVAPVIMAEARAKQICALPAMVALLKEISEQSLFFENEDGYYETTEFHDTAKAILAEIGEIE